MISKINWKEIISLILNLLLVFCLTFLVIHYVGQRTRVSGSSMEPALSNGDNLIVDKISYRFHDPERFDIIIFPYEYEDETYFIKRIIGMPGETIQIGKDGIIFINGEKLPESYCMEVTLNPGSAGTEFTLGEDEYYVMGDNRNDSMDSRDERVGTVQRDNIIGRALLRIYPFDEIGLVLHQ